MAREWHLRGVDPEELKKRQQPEAPQTPRGRWDNFWYHHKWKVILGGVFLVIGAWLVTQSVTRTKPDYMICMVSMHSISPYADAHLEELLVPYGEDLNGDGKVVVEIQCLNVAASTEEVSNPEAIASQQAVLGHMAAKDVDLWALAPEYYTTSIRNALGDESKFFLPLTAMKDVPGVDEKGVYWSWEDIPLLQNDEKLQTMPDVLYWGVANWQNPTEEDRARAADMMKLLERFAEAHAKPQ